jgi:hypothetical protein
MVNNFSNIKKMNNYLSSQLIKHKNMYFLLNAACLAEKQQIPIL